MAYKVELRFNIKVNVPPFSLFRVKGESTLTDAMTAAGKTYEEIAQLVAEQVGQGPSPPPPLCDVIEGTRPQRLCFFFFLFCFVLGVGGGGVAAAAKARICPVSPC